MLRHLLMLLLLAGLALPATTLPAAAMPARAETSLHDCHSAPSHGQKREDGKDVPAGHFCIGCVANARLPGIAAPRAGPPPAPHPRPMAALAGAEIPPSTPPPRA